MGIKFCTGETVRKLSCRPVGASCAGPPVMITDISKD